MAHCVREIYKIFLIKDCKKLPQKNEICAKKIRVTGFFGWKTNGNSERLKICRSFR